MKNNDNMPCLVLNENGSVDDASDGARLALGKLPDREKLFAAMPRDAAERLSDVCASGGRSELFPIRLSTFRFALAVHGKDGTSTYLYLLKRKSDAALVRDVPHLPAESEEIISDERQLPADAVPDFVRAVCRRLEKSGIAGGMRLVLPDASPIPRKSQGALMLGSLTLVLSSVIGFFSAVGSDVTEVTCGSTDGDALITLKAHPGEVPPTLGTSHDITLLSAYFPGTASTLALAERAAEASGMYLSFFADTDGSLSVFVGMLPSSEEYLEFKYGDADEAAAAVLPRIIDLLSSPPFSARGAEAQGR